MSEYGFNCIVIHYGEIALKGNNRLFFEKKLQRNIKRALGALPIANVERLQGRFVVHLNGAASVEDVSEKLNRVFGISHFGLGVAIPKDIEIIKKTAWSVLKDKNFNSFKIATRRAQKEFEFTSMEVNEQVGAYVQERCKKRVDLRQPEATCFVEIAGPYALLYTDRLRGLGGLPVGVSETAVSLLSSGIDSPVASFFMLKRGVNLVYAHFHSQPFTNQASQENVARLVEVLSQFQFRSKVYFVPFIALQKEIMAKAPPELRVLLYRRYMIRLAEEIARRENATALVTGENVGQVASQTLSNIRVVAEVTSLPILRPLAGFDKEEIILKAKKIGTFDISIEPYEDCCSLFVPQNPETKARPPALAHAEELLETDDLMIQAMEQTEIRKIEGINAM